MNAVQYIETTFDMKERKSVKVAEWWFVAHGNILVIEKHGVSGTFQKKNIKVEPNDEYVFSLLKTKIKAIGGAEGLAKFMGGEVVKNSYSCWVSKILNHAMDTMKEAKV